MGKGKKKKKNLPSKFKSSSDATLRPVVQTQNWAELPSDVLSSIFSCLGTIGILTSAQMVCVPWYNVCKEPQTWCTINMKNDRLHDRVHYKLEKMCRYAVDQSCGNLVDIDIEYFATDDLLRYITQRTIRIRRLRLAHCGNISDEGLSKVVSKLTLLEDIDISLCKQLSSESLKVLGNSCPLLKSLKFNKSLFNFSDEEIDYCFRTREDSNAEACAISAAMPGLLHLQLLGNNLDQEGFEMIIKGCAHLESLDLRLCPRLQYLKHNLGGRSDVERLQNLQLPGDSDYDDNNSRYIYHARFRSGDYYDGYYDYSVHNYEDHEHILEHYCDLADFCL